VGGTCVLLGLLFLPQVGATTGKSSILLARRTHSADGSKKKTGPLDDSLQLKPAPDLVLKRDGERKAEALAHFVEGMSLEENGEIEKALAAYRKVLNVDPGQADLACRVAALLSRQEEYPDAIDVLKDAVKASPNAAGPYLQLGLIYAKYLKKTDQALDYCNRGIALDPQNIDGYQRLYEIALANGDEKKARQALDRAAKVNSNDPSFWTRLGKLYALLVFKSDTEPKPNDIKRVNEFFMKAADRAQDDPAVLKEVADYYVSSQQLKQAIPLYLRVLELQPDDTNAREKLATGFILTNQRSKAVDLLEEIIKQQPEKYQAYDLLAQVLDDQGRALQRENKADQAKAKFATAAADYEQSVLINPNHAITYVRLAEILLGPLGQAEKAVKVLSEARRRFPDTPELIYYLALALREAKQTQESVATFEEALRAGEMDSGGIATARFYFDYGVAAEQAGLYDKAADLFKKSIALDPANSAETFNYLGYMWAEQNMHLDEAGEMIKRALQLDPNNGAFLDSLGWVEFRQGRFEQALSDLLRAADNMPKDDPVVFEHIGDTYSKLNRIPQALEAWQKAMLLDPKNKKVAEKIESAKTKLSQSSSPKPQSLH
jgi:tetratricopeptide (TPR) repeat protein